jgi:transcriptional regulator with XRE-family HTH domain
MAKRKKSFFAVRLKELRAASGLSQQQLADASGVPVATLRQYEYSLRSPSFDAVLALARGLGVSLGAFDPPAEAEKPRKGKGK